MNLQFNSLRALIKSGVPFDSENPIVINVIQDVESAHSYLKHQTNKLILEKEKVGRKIETVHQPNVQSERYGNIISKISNRLFDDFHSSMIKNKIQGEWKEYYHSLYDIVVIDLEDIYDTMLESQVIREIFRYWELLPQPKPLDHTDKLYPLVTGIFDLFRELHLEHRQMIERYDIVSSIVKKHRENVENRKECVRLQNEIDKNENMLQVYNEILTWSQ